MKAFSKFLGYTSIKWTLFYFYLFTKASGEWSFEKANAEGYFMFMWLFLAPVAIEVVLLGYPFFYGLNAVEKAQNKSGYYLLFLGLFSIEVAISYWLIGMRYPFIKVAISIILFLLIFRKQLLKR